MKVSFFAVSIIFIVPLFFSCATEQEDLRAEVSGIKKQALDIEQTIQWTMSVQTVELSEVKGAEGLSSSVKPSPQNLSVKSAEHSVYPFIRGFAGTDLSLVEDGFVSAAESFCKALVSSEVPDSLFLSSRLFIKTVFLYNFYEQSSQKKAESFLLGEPFLCEDYVQFPVRLYFSSDEKNYETRPHLDFFADIVKNDGGFFISGLNFKKQEE